MMTSTGRAELQRVGGDREVALEAQVEQVGRACRATIAIRVRLDGNTSGAGEKAGWKPPTVSTTYGSAPQRQPERGAAGELEDLQQVAVDEDGVEAEGLRLRSRARRGCRGGSAGRAGRRPGCRYRPRGPSRAARPSGAGQLDEDPDVEADQLGPGQLERSARRRRRRRSAGTPRRGRRAAPARCGSGPRARGSGRPCRWRSGRAARRRRSAVEREQAADRREREPEADLDRRERRAAARRAARSPGRRRAAGVSRSPMAVTPIGADARPRTAGVAAGGRVEADEAAAADRPGVDGQARARWAAGTRKPRSTGPRLPRAKREVARRHRCRRRDRRTDRGRHHGGGPGAPAPGTRRSAGVSSISLSRAGPICTSTGSVTVSAAPPGEHQPGARSPLALRGRSPRRASRAGPTRGSRRCPPAESTR